MPETVDEAREAGGAPSWFDTVALVGDRLVPERADWVVMHVRTAVLDVVRAGRPARLDGAAIGPPTDGEALALVALRHRDGDHEAALPRSVPIPPGAFTWRPPRAGNPVAEARAWVRRHLPEIADRRVRDDLGDDLDLVVSELVGNAVRHGGGVGAVTVSRQGDAVRVWVRDRDDRPPTRRTPRPESESGRGIAIVEALSTRWAVAHDLADGGKAVWADLALQPPERAAPPPGGLGMPWIG